MSNVIKINDFDAKELDVYARLSEGQLLNRHEPEKGIFIAESPIVVESNLFTGCICSGLPSICQYVISI